VACDACHRSILLKPQCDAFSRHVVATGLDFLYQAI